MWGSGKIVSAETKQRQPRAFHVRKGGIDFLALAVVERTYPGAGRLEVLAVPGRTALQWFTCHLLLQYVPAGSGVSTLIAWRQGDAVLPQGKPRRDDQLHDKGRQHRRRWRSDRRG